MFAHYANANIRETTLLDALKSPIFMQYYERQPFNDNLLRPCPILENRDVLADMVETAGAHSTDLQAKEARATCAPSARVPSRNGNLWPSASGPTPPIRCSINVTIPAKAWPKPIRTSSIA